MVAWEKNIDEDDDEGFLKKKTKQNKTNGDLFYFPFGKGIAGPMGTK